MKRLLTPALLATLAIGATASFSAYAASSTDVSPAERAKIEEVVRQYLLAKPEIIVEAMQVLQTKQFEQAKQAVQKTQQDAPRFIKPLFHQANDPVIGNPNGKVTLVEFFDYQCPHCIDMGPALEAAIKNNANLRVVFKEWPIRGPASEFASRAALAANKQGKYLALHKALLNAGKPLTQDLILELAKTAGLDVNQLTKDMNDSSIDQQLKDTMKLAQDLKLFGTPAFFVGMTDTKSGPVAYVPGQLTQSQLQELIDKAIKGNLPN